MIAGLGSLSSFGVSTEVTPGTPPGTTPDVFVPIVSESVAGSRNPLPSGSIVGDSMVQAVGDGVIACEGGYQLEFEGSNVGQSIWLWNGDNGYTPASIATSYVTSAPTLGDVAGGTLPVGTYRYKVATILERTADGRRLIMPASAEATFTNTNPTITVAWTNPLLANIPEGYTQYGTAIYRTAAGGASNSQTWLAAVVGTGTTYNDTGSATPVLTTLPYSATLYHHEFVGSPPVSGDRLKSFTYFANKNNDNAERYTYCMMDQMSIGVGSIGDKVMADFSLKGAAMDLIANFTPTFVPLAPFVGWQAKGYINDVADCTLENFQIQCGNNVVHVPGICMTPYNRAVISGKREVNVSFSRQFSDHDFWEKMVNGVEFSLAFEMFGQSIVNVYTYGITAAQSGLPQDLVPWQYYSKIDIFRLKANRAGGNVGGPDRIVESINCVAFKNPTEGTEMKIQMWNTTSAYV